MSEIGRLANIIINTSLSTLTGTGALGINGTGIYLKMIYSI